MTRRLRLGLKLVPTYVRLALSCSGRSVGEDVSMKGTKKAVREVDRFCAIERPPELILYNVLYNVTEPSVPWQIKIP